MIADSAAYFLAYDALSHAGPASVDRFRAAMASNDYCNAFANKTSTSFDSAVNSLQNTVTALLGFFTPLGPKVRALKEPPLRVSSPFRIANAESSYTNLNPL